MAKLSDLAAKLPNPLGAAALLAADPGPAALQRLSTPPTYIKVILRTIAEDWASDYVKDVDTMEHFLALCHHPASPAELETLSRMRQLFRGMVDESISLIDALPDAPLHGDESHPTS